MGLKGIPEGNSDVKKLDTSKVELPPQGEHLVDKKLQAQEITNKLIAEYIKNGNISAENLKKLSEMGYSVHDINNILNAARSLGVNTDNLPPSGEHLQRTQTLQELANDLFKKLGFLK